MLKSRYKVIVVILFAASLIYALTGGIVCDNSAKFREVIPDKVARGPFEPTIELFAAKQRTTVLPFLFYYQKDGADNAISIVLNTKGAAEQEIEQVIFSQFIIEYDSGARQEVFPSNTKVQYSKKRTGEQPIWLLANEKTLAFTKIAVCDEKDVNCYSRLGPVPLKSKGSFTLKIRGDAISEDEQKKRFFFKQSWVWEASSQWQSVDSLDD